jgi:peroxiredoxin
MTVAVGEAAPDFILPDTDGDEQQLLVGAPATAIVFTCNHCPYALAWHDRLLDVARDYAPRGVRVVMVNPNDADRYPRDSADASRERVRADGGWPAPYLVDERQEAAHAYGAKTTPDVFVVDPAGILRYRGAPDSDYESPRERALWLRDALDAVLAGEPPVPAETEPVGCSIKWKPGG